MLLLRSSHRLGQSVLARTGEYFVDSTNGSDSANGATRAYPLKTLAGVKTKHGSATYPAIANVIAPSSAPLREQLVWDKTVSLTIQPVPGQSSWTIYGSEQFTSGWSSAGGGVYSRVLSARTSVPRVLVSSLTDGSGFWLDLTSAGTSTTPPAGSYGFVDVGDTLYIHLPADANPNSHTIEVPLNNYCVTSTRQPGVTLINAVGRAAVNSCFRAAATDALGFGSLFATDCTAEYGGSAGGFATDIDWTAATFTRCVAKRAQNDGFNIHGSAGITSTATLIDCDSSYNLDEGASPHDDTRLVMTRGRMHHNASSGMAAVDRCVVTMTGVEVDHNQTSGVDPLTGGISIANTVTATLTGNNVHDNPNEGIKAAATSSVTVSGNTSGLAAGNGLADNLVA